MDKSEVSDSQFRNWLLDPMNKTLKKKNYLKFRRWFKNFLLSDGWRMNRIIYHKLPCGWTLIQISFKPNFCKFKKNSCKFPIFHTVCLQNVLQITAESRDQPKLSNITNRLLTVLRTNYNQLTRLSAVWPKKCQDVKKWVKCEFD